MMQLLYGNDGINYHTIAHSGDMTPVQEKELLEGYLGYDFVKDSSKYSDFSKEPIAISYVTTNLSNTLPQEKIVIAQNARMTNYLTPSYYAHFQLLDMSKELYGERFTELLRYSFIQDVDLKKYLDKDIDLFHPVVNSNPIATDAIEKDKLIPIVASILDVADSISQQVQVVLDVEGDAYNKRALEVIATIYKYLPYNIRKKVGFTTYAGTEASKSSRIKLKLYTRDALGRLGSGAIDLRDMDSSRILGKLPKIAVDLARDFVMQDETQRKEWFRSFQQVFGLKNVSVEDHVMFFRNLRSWQNEDLEKLKDHLARYAASEINKTPESPIFTMFKNIISQRFVREGYLPRYGKIIEELLAQNESYDYDNRLKAYIMLGETLDTVTFERQSFLDWQDQKMVKPVENCEELELIRCFKAQQQAIHNMQCGKGKFQSIRAEMESNIKDYLEALKKEIQRKAKMEKRGVLAFFVDPVGSDPAKIKECFAHIRYEDNKRVFKKALFGKLERVLGATPYLRSMEAYEKWEEDLRGYEDYLEQEDAESLRDLIEQKGEVVKSMENIKVVRWNDKTDILKTYQNMADMKAVSEGKQVEVPDYVLYVKEEYFNLPGEELEALTEFLLVPTDQNILKFRRLVRTHMDLLGSLCEINGYGEAHFNYLMSLTENDEREQRRALRYYLSKDVLLSSDQVSEGLMKVDIDVLRKMGEIKGKNIVCNVFRSKMGRGGMENRGTDFGRDSGLDRKRNDDRGMSPDGKRDYGRKTEQKRVNLPKIVLIATLIPALVFAAISFLSIVIEFKMMTIMIISLVMLVATASCAIIQSYFPDDEANEGWIGGGIGFGLSVLATWASFMLYIR